MKQLIVCTFFYLLSATASYSQSFGGNNAVWHYNFYSVWPPLYYSPIIITSSPADTVNGIVYYTLTRNDSLAFDCSFVPLTDTVYESNDTVYYYLATTNRYTMLYNWNALPGDTEVIYVDSFSGEDSIFLSIDSINTININGFTKKIFYTTCFSTFFNWFFGYQIIEDIGSTCFLFPQYAFCDPLTCGIRCYYDTIIGLYQPWLPGSECDSVIYLGENELTLKTGFSIYPNPTTDFITITSALLIHSEIQIQLYNLYGQLLSFYKSAGNQETTLSLKEYPAGIYFVKTNADGKEVVRKVVKL